MNRDVRHTAYVSRNYEDICSYLERDSSSALSQATKDASRRATNLVVHLEEDLQFFHLDEDVNITATELERLAEHHAVMKFEWLADRRKRLLPSLKAQLELNAIIPRGSNATTAISVVGKFDPPAGLVQRIEEVLVTRRVVGAAAHTFIETMAKVLEEELPAPEPRQTPRPSGPKPTR